MTFSPEDKKALSDIRFEKASEFFKDAQANFEETRLKTAINRSYYAALNAVGPCLFSKASIPKRIMAPLPL